MQYSNRINTLQKNLAKKKLDAVVISSPAHITYLTGFGNFSTEERDGYVLITKDRAFILTHSIYIENVKKEVKGLKPIKISRREPVGKTIKKLIKLPAVRLGIEEGNLTAREYKHLVREFESVLNFEARLIRGVKEDKEIELIKTACFIGDSVFDQILKEVKQGISEKELAYRLENLIYKMGAQSSFKTIIAFGKNSAYPHHQPGETVLKDGDQILMDFGIKFGGYCSDMTRTIFFRKPTSGQKRMYKTVLSSQQAAIDYINSRVKSGKKIMAQKVDKVARAYIVKNGFPAIPHSLGHGIGLEVHEHPYLSTKSKEILKVGMVFSIEPGIYIPDVGGVRIEDLFVMEDEGVKYLTSSPRELVVI